MKLNFVQAIHKVFGAGPHGCHNPQASREAGEITFVTTLQLKFMLKTFCAYEQLHGMFRCPACMGCAPKLYNLIFDGTSAQRLLQLKTESTMKMRCDQDHVRAGANSQKAVLWTKAEQCRADDRTRLCEQLLVAQIGAEAGFGVHQIEWHAGDAGLGAVDRAH